MLHKKPASTKQKVSDGIFGGIFEMSIFQFFSIFVIFSALSLHYLFFFRLLCHYESDENVMCMTAVFPTTQPSDQGCVVDDAFL